MKRKISMAAVAVISSAAIFTSSVYADSIKIEIDNNTVESDTAPQITAEGRTIVPLRVISENLGAKVNWDGDKKLVSVVKDGKTLSLTIGEKKMDNNGETIKLDSPAQIVNSRTMVPLRAISESFGCDVAWDGTEKKVTITSPATASDNKTAENKTDENKTTDNKADSSTTSDTSKSDTKENSGTLPKFTYSGSEKYADAVCKKIIEHTADSYDAADVAIPVPLILETDDKDSNDIKVWGNFEIYNYKLNGDTLECESGGSYPGCMHLKKTDKGFEVTSFDVVADGEDYNESLKKICEGNADIIKKFSLDQETREALRKSTIEEYVKQNNLNIKAYKDYGWDPVLLTTTNK